MNHLDTLQTAIDTMQQMLDTDPIADSAFQNPTPCAEFTVAQLAEHIIDTHNLLLGTAGGQPVETGETFSQHHSAVAKAATSRWATRGTDGTINLGGNELPAAFGLSLHALETYVHAWDLATALHRPFTPPTELVRAMTDFAESFITDDIRGEFAGAPYAAAAEAPADASDADRLIAFTGRDPLWSPS